MDFKVPLMKTAEAGPISSLEFSGVFQHHSVGEVSQNRLGPRVQVPCS